MDSIVVCRACFNPSDYPQTVISWSKGSVEGLGVGPDMWTGEVFHNRTKFETPLRTRWLQTDDKPIYAQIGQSLPIGVIHVGLCPHEYGAAKSASFRGHGITERDIQWATELIHAWICDAERSAEMEEMHRAP